MKRIPAPVWAAPALFLFDAFVLAQGLLSLAAACVVVLAGVPLCLHAAFRDRARLPRRAAVLGVFLLLPLAVRGANALNESLAHRRADALIEACRRFRAAQGRYPDRLEELVPAFIPRVPAAKIGLVFDRFEYHASGAAHSLQWISFPPHMRTYYVLEEGRWGVSER